MGSAKADSSRMPLMARLKPSLANCAAQPKPMPREPPVTKATGFRDFPLFIFEMSSVIFLNVKF